MRWSQIDMTDYLTFREASQVARSYTLANKLATRLLRKSNSCWVVEAYVERPIVLLDEATLASDRQEAEYEEWVQQEELSYLAESAESKWDAYSSSDFAQKPQINPDTGSTSPYSSGRYYVPVPAWHVIDE